MHFLLFILFKTPPSLSFYHCLPSHVAWTKASINVGNCAIESTANLLAAAGELAMASSSTCRMSVPTETTMMWVPSTRACKNK